MPRARRATPDDRPGALGAWRVATTVDDRSPHPARVRRVAAKLAAPDALVLVAGVEDGVTGMLLGEPGRRDYGRGPLEPGLLHLALLFVLPDARRAGTGTALLAGLAEHAAAAGYDRATLWTAEDNAPARRFYTRAGFTPTGRRATLPSAGPVLQLGAALHTVAAACSLTPAAAARAA